jgi:hypothetical protein
MKRWGFWAMAALMVSGAWAGTAAAARSTAPTLAAIRAVLHNAHELGTPSEHLSLMGKPVTVSDGAGGTLTAVAAVRFPTADGYGQYVLFWHDATLVGSQNLTPLPRLGPEAVQLRIVRSGPDRITIKFARYKKTDPLYAPSLPPGYVTYAWKKGRLVASGPVPTGTGNGLAMVLGNPPTPAITWQFLPAGTLSQGVGASVAATAIPNGWILTRLEFIGGPHLLVSETPEQAMTTTRPRADGSFSMGQDGEVITFLFPDPPGRWLHQTVRFVFLYQARGVVHVVSSHPFPFPHE